MMRPPSMPPAAQRGLALACVLLLLAATMVIGVAVARGAFALLASARNDGDRVTARLAAEAALLDAERDLAGAGASADAAARAALLAQADGAGFVDGCGRGPADLGLCRAAAPPAWHGIDLADPDADVLVPYGRYTGAVLPLAAGMLPARLPGYLIEKLAPAGADPAQGSFYRITAIGFGTRTSTQVILQSLYRAPAPEAPVAAGADEENEEEGGDEDDDEPGAGPDPPRSAATPPPLPAGRIGWREIANWPELHARAQQ
nr:pilus assembly protein [uncultured Massilia sp.]